MIDLERERLVTIAAAPQIVPAIDAVPGMEARRPLHPRTIFNWATKGKRGVVLETVSVGGILTTSYEALVRFFVRVNIAREQRIHQYRNESDRRPTRRRSETNTAARMKLAQTHGV